MMAWTLRFTACMEKNCGQGARLLGIAGFWINTSHPQIWESMQFGSYRSFLVERSTTPCFPGRLCASGTTSGRSAASPCGCCPRVSCRVSLLVRSCHKIYMIYQSARLFKAACTFKACQLSRSPSKVVSSLNQVRQLRQ